MTYAPRAASDVNADKKSGDDASGKGGGPSAGYKRGRYGDKAGGGGGEDGPFYALTP